MAEFWNLIVQSNTFNFIVMLVIFAIIWQKLNVSEKLEGMRLSIASFIENSKIAREKSEDYLKEAEKSVENLDFEINNKIENAQQLAQNVFDEIQSMTEANIKKIEANVENVIENETRKCISRLTEETAQKAVELAKIRLKEKFNQQPELHQIYIEEAIKIL